MEGLDRWITDSRYSAELLLVTCRECGEETPVESETEYGRTGWSPEECKHCHTPFTGEEDSEPDGPDEDLAYERWVDEEMR